MHSLERTNRKLGWFDMNYSGSNSNRRARSGVLRSGTSFGPHKRFRPGHALRLSRQLQWFCNKLARTQNGFQWLQALEQCLTCKGIAISTEYFGGGFTISSSTWIHIRPFMTVRGRFYNLVREYALMKLIQNTYSAATHRSRRAMLRQWRSPSREQWGWQLLAKASMK